MNVVTSLCGRVRQPFSYPIPLPLLTMRAFQDVNVDLEDDVSLLVLHLCLVFEVHVSANLAHRAPGNTLSTIQEDHRFSFGLSPPGSKRHFIDFSRFLTQRIS